MDLKKFYINLFIILIFHTISLTIVLTSQSNNSTRDSLPHIYHSHNKLSDLFHHVLGIRIFHNICTSKLHSFILYKSFIALSNIFLHFPSIVMLGICIAKVKSVDLEYFLIHSSSQKAKRLG